jgi:hypothetical protein
LSIGADDSADCARVEGRNSEAVAEANERRVFREEVGHALFELCDLCKLAVVGLVLVDKEEKRLCPGDILWFGREFRNGGLKDSTSICKDCQYG